MEKFFKVLYELASRVPTEQAAFVLIFLIMLFLFIYLLKKQEEKHHEQIEVLAGVVERLSDSVTNNSKKSAEAMGELKGSMDSIVPVIIKIIEKRI